MGKKQKVKYRIIPETLMKDLVEFLDEVQFDASKTNTTESHHLLNLCNYLISCLINSDGFTDEFNNSDEVNDSDIPYDWESSSFGADFNYDINDMSDEEYKKMISEFDKFFFGWKKTYYNTSKKLKNNSISLKEFGDELKYDTDLTPQEKFELYYNEYYKINNKPTSLDSMIRKLGLKKSENK